MSPSGYPPPDDDEPDDAEAGQRYLDQLAAELESAGAYGTPEWRAARDQQMLRLRHFGWTPADLADHYRVTRSTVYAALARSSGTPERSWQLRVTADRHQLAALREFLDERGIRHAISEIA